MGIGDQMMLEQTEFPEKIQIRFALDRCEQSDTVFAGQKSAQIFANPERPLPSLALTQSAQPFAHNLAQERFIGKMRSGICHGKTIQ
jgi:hypothetical protein